MLSSDGLDNIKKMLMRDEGIKFKPYYDTVGKLTIGVGRNLDDVGMFADEIKLMLENDIKYFYNKLDERFSWFKYLDEVRQLVLIDMAFMGMKSLLSFKNMFKAIDSKDYARAAEEILDSKYARQVGDRAKRLAEQMEVGKVVENGFIVIGEPSR